MARATERCPTLRRAWACVTLMGLAGCGGRVNSGSAVDQTGSAGTTSQSDTVLTTTAGGAQADPNGTVGAGGACSVSKCDDGQPLPPRMGGGTNPASGSKCWSSQLPGEVQPLLPRSTVERACRAATWAVSPQIAGTIGELRDGRAEIVGRWVACPGSALMHAGLEFGANGRFQFLERTAQGELVSSASSPPGRYYMLDSGQLDLVNDDASPRRFIAHVTLGGDGDALRVVSDEAAWSLPGIYARTTPSPLNGRDNPPSVSDGTCTLAGDWRVESVEDTDPARPDPRGSFSFDEVGNFVGGPLASDLCAAHTMYGTYRLTPGLFELTTGIGMGECGWALDGGYTAQFENTCTRLRLKATFDNCTLGRGYFNHPTVLVRTP